MNSSHYFQLLSVVFQSNQNYSIIFTQFFLEVFLHIDRIFLFCKSTQFTFVSLSMCCATAFCCQYRKYQHISGFRCTLCIRIYLTVVSRWLEEIQCGYQYNEESMRYTVYGTTSANFHICLLCMCVYVDL